uniref:Ig-like domain-containing protein n=1 Tax=Rhabditophanes sp. KR3021 TaxID=114890 RepID=A0AC35TRH5_9BILA
MLMFVHFLVVLSLITSTTQQQPKQRTSEQRKKYLVAYQRYQQCVKDHFFHDVKYGSQLFRNVVGLRGGALELKCFECLTPEEREHTEDAWKPNGNTLMRKISKIKYGVMKMLKSEEDIEADKIHDERWNYQWHVIRPGNKQKRWLDLYKAPRSKGSYKSAVQYVKSFFAEDKKFRIGDNFQIEIKNLQSENLGFYRCLNTKDPTAPAGNFYFVDLINIQPVEFINFNESKVLLDALKQDFPEEKVQRYGRVSQWSKCDICDNEHSVQRKVVECYIRPMPGVTLADMAKSFNFSILELFGEVPCSSTLIPPFFRGHRKPFTKYLIVKRCRLKCEDHHEQIVEEKIYGNDEAGNRILIDTLPADEYSVQHRLPQLKPEVQREAISRTEGAFLILDCGFGEYGMYWKKETVLLTDGILFDTYKGRTYVNERFQLLFEYTIMDDGGFYSCYSANSFLLSTHSVTLLQTSKTEEWQIIIRSFIQFCVVIFMIMILLGAILKTRNSGDKKAMASKGVKKENKNQKEEIDNSNEPKDTANL